MVRENTADWSVPQKFTVKLHTVTNEKITKIFPCNSFNVSS